MCLKWKYGHKNAQLLRCRVSVDPAVSAQCTEFNSDCCLELYPDLRLTTEYPVSTLRSVAFERDKKQKALLLLKYGSGWFGVFDVVLVD